MESTDNIDLLTLVVIATMGIFLLLLFVVLFVIVHQKKMLAHRNLVREQESMFQKKLLESAFESAQQERMKLATDLHDDFGMMMNLLKVNLSRVQHNLDQREMVADLTNNSHEIVDEIIQTIRSISHDLMPPTLMKLGFVEGLSELCRQISDSGAVDIALISASDHINLESKRAFHLYRLVKELVNNTIKHAGASTIRIMLAIDHGQLKIGITHDGTGISNETIRQLAKSGKGLGLTSTLSRAQIIDATIDYVSETAEKPGVYLELPLL